MKNIHNQNSKQVTISQNEYIELLKYRKDFLSAKEENIVIKEENTVIKEENLVLEQQVSNLLEELSKFKRDKFGSSSEKTSDELMEQMSLFFNEIEFTEDQFEKQTEEKEEEKQEVKSHSRKKPKYSGAVEDILPKNIQKEVVIHETSLEERMCPCCNKEMTQIGKDVYKSLVIIPAKAVQKEDHYITYACKCCDKEGLSTPILKTPHKKTVIPGGFASPEAIAYLIYHKFVMYSPLYRMAEDFKRQGIMLTRQTMSNWLLKATESWLNPVYEAMIPELLRQTVLHTDETTLQVLHEEGKEATSKSYMWLYRTSGATDRAIAIYKYEKDRKGEHPKDFLKKFKGYLHCDGYEVYHNLHKDVIIVGCWAHARRYFEQAVNALPKGKTAGTSALKGLAYCQNLFSLEQEFADLSPEKRHKQRLERSKSVVDEFFSWAKTRQAAPKSLLGKAFTYLENQEAYLRGFLEDGRLELSNNRAERSIKPFVMGRKNFLFANTPKGAHASSVMYSLVETAKENGLNPYEYLVYVLKTAPNLDRKKKNWVEELLPWNAPESCRVPM